MNVCDVRLAPTQPDPPAVTVMLGYGTGNFVRPQPNVSTYTLPTTNDA